MTEDRKTNLLLKYDEVKADCESEKFIALSLNEVKITSILELDMFNDFGLRNESQRMKAAQTGGAALVIIFPNAVLKGTTLTVAICASDVV